jgi:hypothetical protein
MFACVFVWAKCGDVAAEAATYKAWFVLLRVGVSCFAPTALGGQEISNWKFEIGSFQISGEMQVQDH